VRWSRISVGHAKVILGLANPVQQSEAAERVIKEGLNVRQAEGLIAKLQSRGVSKKAAKTTLPTDAHVANLENKIREKLGTKVSLRYAKGKGALEISFYSDAELEGVLQALGVNAD
jgi:ParB family chromosome partitioning protein